MYRLHAWFDFFLTIVYCTVWIAFAIWIPWNKKHHYDFGEHDDQFRLSLFVIGICFAIFFLFQEMRQVVNEYNYEKVKKITNVFIT